MSRSGYSHDCDEGWALYRGRVASAVRGKRGQRLFREMLAALDAMPLKRLIESALVGDRAGDVCVLGCLGQARGLDLGSIDAYQADEVAGAFDIAEQLAREVVYMNDEAYYYTEIPEHRWRRMRKWVVDNILDAPQAAAS